MKNSCQRQLVQSEGYLTLPFAFGIQAGTYEESRQCPLTRHRLVGRRVRLRAVDGALAPLGEGMDGDEVGSILAVGVGHHPIQFGNDLRRASRVRAQEDSFL